jgi:hypothetical protein
MSVKDPHQGLQRSQLEVEDEAVAGEEEEPHEENDGEMLRTRRPPHEDSSQGEGPDL